jgi:hypothetical protein
MRAQQTVGAKLSDDNSFADNRTALVYNPFHSDPAYLAKAEALLQGHTADSC